MAEVRAAVPMRARELARRLDVSHATVYRIIERFGARSTRPRRQCVAVLWSVEGELTAARGGPP